MPRPRLLHPLKVTIAQISKATTLMDDNLREPIGGPERSAAITVLAQVTYRRQDDPRADREALNVEEHSLGWLTLRVADLQEASVVLVRGDMITKIGDGRFEEAVAYFLTSKGPLAHSGTGGQLLRFYFTDRQPVATR